MTEISGSAPWEYRIETVKSSEVGAFGDQLNRLGADSWELVSMAGTVQEGVPLNDHIVVFCFRRPGLGQFSTETPWA